MSADSAACTRSSAATVHRNMHETSCTTSHTTVDATAETGPACVGTNMHGTRRTTSWGYRASNSRTGNHAPGSRSTAAVAGMSRSCVPSPRRVESDTCEPAPRQTTCTPPNRHATCPRTRSATPLERSRWPSADSAACTRSSAATACRDMHETSSTTSPAMPDLTAETGAAHVVANMPAAHLECRIIGGRTRVLDASCVGGRPLQGIAKSARHDVIRAPCLNRQSRGRNARRRRRRPRKGTIRFHGRLPLRSRLQTRLTGSLDEPVNETKTRVRRLAHATDIIRA